MNAKILVADDDEQVRDVLRDALTGFGCQVSLSADGDQALAAIEEGVYDVIFLDYRMPGVDGMEVLERARSLSPDSAVVLITGEGSEQVARDAFKLGAFDYVTKPLRKIHDLEIIVGQALERQALRTENAGLKRENTDLRRRVDRQLGVAGLVGNSKEMQKVLDLIDRIASTRSTVLISGESGTGKELVARALHSEGDRSSRPFVSVNCGALPDNLLEDELFGHVRGAFTDAISDRLGRFELAHQGTLFLDEIGTMSQNLQVKLLRVLQEREFTPLGSTRRVTVDVRIIAATNNDLKEMIEDGRFRSDLYYRLNVIHVRLPSLRERRGDIPLMLTHFLSRCCAEQGAPPKTFTQAAIRQMMAFDWPGNVRQLENAVERGVALSGGRPTLDLSDLPEELQTRESHSFNLPEARGDGIHLGTAVSDFEGRLLLQALENADWVKTRAARLLHIKRTTLIEKMKRLGIPLRSRNVTERSSTVTPDRTEDAS